METERRCNLRTLVFTVFSQFFKSNFQYFRFRYKYKLHVQNLSNCSRSISQIFETILLACFFSIWPNCATAANLEVWLGGHRRLLHYYLNGLQPLCSPLRFSFGLFGPGKQKKILNLKNLSREDRLFSGRGNTVQ